MRAGSAQLACAELCGLRKASSVHITFMPQAEATLAEAQGFLLRTDQQFHWENAGHATFDDFLSSLASRKRKLIKRERRDAVANGIEIVWLTGSDLTRSGVGRVLPLLHGYRVAQMGPALSHPRVLFADRARPWPTRCCW